MSTTINDSCDRLNPSYASYSPDASTIAELTPLLEHKTITMVIGTWCSDSKTHVPPFYKILDIVRFPSAAINLIEVDEQKQALNRNITNLNISSVPTFIIFENGQELGRITEKPQTTLEQDLLQLLVKG